MADPMRLQRSEPEVGGPTPPVISVVAKSGMGKTTLLERLLPEIRERGLRVGVLKHYSDGLPIPQFALHDATGLSGLIADHVGRDR